MPVITDPRFTPYFVSCDEIWSSRRGTPYDFTGARQGRREYLRRFKVITKVKQLGDVAVMACPGLPLPGSFYVSPTDYDLLAVAIKADVSQEHEDDWQNRIVEVLYSTEVPRGGFPAFPGVASGNQGSQNNPELEFPTIDWDFEIVQQSPMHDLDGYPFLNTAWMPFSPPPSFPEAYPILSITRNELGFDRAKATRYAFALNDDKFLGMPAETVQCLPPKAQQMHRGSKMFWKVSYKLKFSFLVDDGNDPDFKADAEGNHVGYRVFQPRLLSYGSWQRPVGKPVPADGNPSSDSVRTIVNGAPMPDLLDWVGRQAVFGSPSRVLKPDMTTVIKTVAGRPGVKPWTFVQYRRFRKLSFKDLIVNGLK